MNVERINELKRFVEDFNAQLEEAYKRHEENLSKVKEVDKSEQTQLIKEKRRKKTFSDNIFIDPPPWRPNKYHNDYFDEVKILNPKYFLNDWDKERISFCKRSYTKENELRHQNIKYTNIHGTEFGTPSLNKLSDLGLNIINNFINDNKKKEELIKQKEQDIENYKKSRPSPVLNKWKFNDFYSKEFEKLKVDDAYYFKQDPKPNYFIKQPFKIPKKDGDYFEKPKYE